MVPALLATMLAALLFHVALEYLDKKATQAICVEHDSGTSCKHHDGALRPPPTRCEACSHLPAARPTCASSPRRAST